ncbi:MAG: hypothetical protein IKR85_10660 [Clostridia bacterium]|nr:hypothetical protein [Clostridia bacterium]
MNADYLHELINRYEASFDIINDTDHYELFKWQAMKTWRQEWFKPAESFPTFAERFNAARKNFSLFVDNSRMHPAAGVVPLWKEAPDAVEHLFYDVLFADANRDADTAQEHMDAFVDDYNALLLQHFPRNWSYKQDRHSASVFMAMNEPDFNYVFKSGNARRLAQCIDFGLIGVGAYFRLKDYYRLCDTIVEALREHKSLLEKHFSTLNETHYRDESLHLMAFDLVYCSQTYNYYKGLLTPSRTVPIKKAGSSHVDYEKLARQEEERNAKIAAIEDEIAKLENSCDGVEDISLLGVQVTSPEYGTGTVVSQEINRITVQFEAAKTTFVLNSAYRRLPHFEDEEQVLEAFTAYGNAQEKIEKLKRKLEILRKRT